MVADILAGVRMFVPLSQQNSVAIVGDADIKLDRVVVVTKLQAEFEDGCGTNTQWVLRT